MHIEMLKKWWENAEDSDVFYPGDTWIKRHKASTGGWVYDVGRVTAERRYYDCRVLSRAPKPKPAWHNAPAVIATGDSGDGDLFTGIWIPHGSPERWECADVGIILGPERLYDVTPLIEAKVTDEMVERGRDIGVKGKMPDPELVRRILTAALGVEEGS